MWKSSQILGGCKSLRQEPGRKSAPTAANVELLVKLRSSQKTAGPPRWMLACIYRIDALVIHVKVQLSFRPFGVWCRRATQDRCNPTPRQRLASISIPNVTEIRNSSLLTTSSTRWKGPTSEKPGLVGEIRHSGTAEKESRNGSLYVTRKRHYKSDVT